MKPPAGGSALQRVPSAAVHSSTSTRRGTSAALSRVTGQTQRNGQGVSCACVSVGQCNPLTFNRQCWVQAGGGQLRPAWPAPLATAQCSWAIAGGTNGLTMHRIARAASTGLVVSTHAVLSLPSSANCTGTTAWYHAHACPRGRLRAQNKVRCRPRCLALQRPLHARNFCGL